MNEFNTILQFHIDNHLTRVKRSAARGMQPGQVSKLQACLDLHYRLNAIKVKPAFGRQSFEEVLADIAMPQTKKRFEWSGLKLTATALASLLVVVVIGGFSWLGANQTTNELSSDSVKPNGTVENLQNLNLAAAQKETETIQSDTSLDKSAQINLSKTSNIDEAVNENF